MSAVGGTLGLHAYPFPADSAVLALIHVVRPALYAGFTYAYGTLWFTSVFFVSSIGLSCPTIFVGRGGRAMLTAPLPPYPAPDHRKDLFLVLGEQHRRTTPARAAQPSWVAVPERGLYTGILVVGAIGSRKTSACMYPYGEQLLAYRANDQAGKAAGLVLEVKADFCREVQDILRRHGRAADYVEVSLDSPYRYNPLHTDLDAYALAYGMATLMTSLIGRGKEPFWQQASTNLVKFVILLTNARRLRHALSGVRTRHQRRQAARTHRGRERHHRANHRRIVVDNRKHLVKNIARALGDDVSEEQPILDARLPDGSRVAVVCPPCSVGGTTLTIRKFHTRFFTAEELVRIGTMTPAVLSALRDAITAGANISISGGTSTARRRF